MVGTCSFHCGRDADLLARGLRPRSQPDRAPRRPAPFPATPNFVCGSVAMPFVDTTKLSAFEKRPGWRGRHFHSPSMTFGHWEFSSGSSIHEHAHPQEEVWEILAGELEVTIDGITQIVGPGMAAIVPANTAHALKALSDGKAIVVDYPLRREM